METCGFLRSSNLLGLTAVAANRDFPISDTVTSTLLLLLSGAAESIITNISMIPTSAHWYFRMTPFEAMFMGFIVVQITILHWLQILPITVDPFLNGVPSGRKKRATAAETIQQQKLATTLLRALKRLDSDNCFQLALCELQYKSTNDGYSLPRETKLTLQALKTSSARRRRRLKEGEKNDLTFAVDDENELPLLWLEEAVVLGSRSSSDHPINSNATVCSTKYHSCPATAQDILSNFDVIQSHYF